RVEESWVVDTAARSGFLPPQAHRRPIRSKLAVLRPLMTSRYFAPISASARYVSAEIAAAAGMVKIHPHTMRPATPHFTAERRRVEPTPTIARSEEHTSELQSRSDLVCRLL